MEHCNYNFHKNSYPELTEFLIAVQESGEQPKNNLFCKFFPKVRYNITINPFFGINNRIILERGLETTRTASETSK